MRKFFSRNFLLTVAALALVASVVTGRERPSLDIVEQRVERKLDLDLSALEQRNADAATADPFSPKNFSPEAAPVRRSEKRVVEKPTAPPLPFTYVGRMIDGDKTAIFLARGDESLSVVAGQTIAGEYRVDRVTETEVQFTYLPLKTKQSLPL
jgi:hypothetical protein